MTPDWKLVRLFENPKKLIPFFIALLLRAEAPELASFFFLVKKVPLFILGLEMTDASAVDLA